VGRPSRGRYPARAQQARRYPNQRWAFPVYWHSRINFGIGAQKRRSRSTVGCGAGPAARILSPSLNATDGAIRATRREGGFPVLTAGPVATCQPALSTDLVGGFWPDRCSGVLAPLPPRGSRPRDGKQASKAMTRSGSTSARRVGLITEARRLLLAIDARRRLTPRERVGPQTRSPRSESTLRVPERSRATSTAEPISRSDEQGADMPSVEILNRASERDARPALAEHERS
jgi:hypothetical protein